MTNKQRKSKARIENPEAFKKLLELDLQKKTSKSKKRYLRSEMARNNKKYLKSMDLTDALKSSVVESVKKVLNLTLDYWTDSTVGVVFSVLDNEYNRLKYSYTHATTYGYSTERNEARKEFILNFCKETDPKLYKLLIDDIENDNLDFDLKKLPNHLIKKVLVRNI